MGNQNLSNHEPLNQLPIEGSKTCELCKSDSIDSLSIVFSCHHRICFLCFPYFMLSILRSTGIKQNFFKDQTEYECIICNKGKTIIAFDKINAYFHKKYLDLKQCHFCDGKPKSFCIDCDCYYCEICVGNHHNDEIFKKHKQNDNLEGNDPKNQKINDLPSKYKNECKCKSSSLTVFCLNCNESVCNKCALEYHSNHAIQPIFEIFNQYQQFDNDKVKKGMENLKENFTRFKNHLIKATEEIVAASNKEYDKIFDQIVDLLKKLKQKKDEQSAKEFHNLGIKLRVIEHSIACLKEDIEKNEKNNVFSPNKTFLINKFLLNHAIEKKMEIEDFTIKTLVNDKLKAIIKTLNFDDKKNNIEFVGDDELFKIDKFQKNEEIDLVLKNTRYETFLTDPIYFIKKVKNEALLDSFYFEDNHNISSNSTSFMLNDQSYIVYQTKEREKFFLKIFNISSKVSIQKNYGSTQITFLSTYPKYASYDQKKWLYVGDATGCLKVFDITNTKFEEIYEIKEKIGRKLLSASIFDDKFNELKTYKQKGIYAIISYYDDDCPISIYSLNENKKHLKIREIKNPLHKSCFNIDYYYDDKNKKTCYFFGFEKSFIKAYDFKNNGWLANRIETDGIVTSMNFVLKKINEKIKYMLIFTQNNHVSTVNITGDDWKIIKSRKLHESASINSICVWDYSIKNRLLITTKKENTVQILDIENLETVFIDSLKKKNEFVNILKFLKKDDKNQLKEGLAYFGNTECSNNNMFLQI